MRKTSAPLAEPMAADGCQICGSGNNEHSNNGANKKSNRHKPEQSSIEGRTEKPQLAKHARLLGPACQQRDEQIHQCTGRPCSAEDLEKKARTGQLSCNGLELFKPA